METKELIGWILFIGVILWICSIFPFLGYVLVFFVILCIAGLLIGG
jgi:hypothetical protein